jgi:putative hydrolase of the HAD superfamily
VSGDRAETRAIIFDVGGVLWQGKPLFVWPKSDKSRFRALVRRYQKGALSPVRFWGEASKLTGIDAIILKERFLERLSSRRFPEPLMRLVDRLAEDYTLAVFSNSVEEQTSFLEKQDMMRKFKVRVWSCRCGAMKPEKEFYRILLKRLKVDPRHCVYVDDRKPFLGPARDIGIKTVLYRKGIDLDRILRSKSSGQ